MNVITMGAHILHVLIGPVTDIPPGQETVNPMCRHRCRFCRQGPTASGPACMCRAPTSYTRWTTSTRR